jgi:hypothetical protein
VDPQARIRREESIGASWDLTQPEDAAKTNSLLRHIELLSK